MSKEVFFEKIRAKSNREHLKNDPYSNVWRKTDGAVLLCDRIKEYCEDQNIKLVVPFEEEYFEPASYQLRLGDLYRIEGVDKHLTDDNSILTIEPHGIAIVRTYEWINLPGFLIARWNLKVKKVYEGLVWVGGPQVDPGYQGYLSCPLYNLSSNPVKLEYKKPLFIIDFLRTTVYDESKGCKLWEADPPRSIDSFGSFDPNKLVSAVKDRFKTIGNDINNMKDELIGHGKNMTTFQNTTFVVLAVIITAVTVLATLSSLETIKVPIIYRYSLIISIITFVVVLKTRKKTGSNSNSSKSNKPD